MLIRLSGRQTAFCTVSQKRISDNIDFSLENDYQILIIIGTNIPDTTGHEMTT